MKKEELECFNLKDIEDEDLKCSICHYYFTNNLKPYSLNCNHNLCLKCIDALIEKNMYNCPICRRSFSLEERKNFQINEKYLSFVTKILKLKFIFCIRCQKVFNFIEHFENCDQINFKDSHESFDDINNLARDCLKIIKSSDRHLNILSNSKVSIYEEIHRIMKIININFYEFFNKTLEKFIEGIPKINHEEVFEEIFNYIKFYDMFMKSIKIDKIEVIKKDSFDLWIENHINKLPLLSEGNGGTTPIKDITTTEIQQFKFANFKYFKEIKNSLNLNLKGEKFIDYENDSEYDFNNKHDSTKTNNGDPDIANKYKIDNLSQIDVLFSKHKNKDNGENQDRLINTNKFKDLSSIKANKNHEKYNTEEDLDYENVNRENSPFKLNKNEKTEQIKNPLVLSYNNYKLQTKNISNYNSKNLNNKFNKDNYVLRKGYSQMQNNELKENFLNKNDHLKYNANNSKHQSNYNANVLSFSIDKILIKNFDKYQKNYIDSRKKSPQNFNTERKNHAGVYSKEPKSKYNETLRSESEDSTYRNKFDKETVNNFNTNINNQIRNNKRRFTNFSENSNNTHVIDNYNFIDHFNNNNILSDSFSSISNEDLNFIKGNKIKEKIHNINLEKLDEVDCKNEKDVIINNKNDYDSINQNSHNKVIKNNKNFSFKKSNKNVSKLSNEIGTIITDSNFDSNIGERLNKSDNTINDEISSNDKYKVFENKEKEKFNMMLRNIKIASNSDKEFKFIGHGELENLEPPMQKANKSKEHVFHKRSFDYSNLDRNNKNNKESDLSQRQKIIVRNDQVKIIHNENHEKETKKMTPSKVEIRDNKIRLVSNSPNTSFKSKNKDGTSNSSNKIEKEHITNLQEGSNDLNDCRSINNNISEGTSTIKTAFIDKYRFDNNPNSKENYNDLSNEKRRSQSKLINMNALYNLSRNTSANKSKNLDDFKLNENNQTNNNKHIINLNPYPTKMINSTNKISTNKIQFEKENNISNKKTKEFFNRKNPDLNDDDDQNEKFYDEIYNIAELKQKENNKYVKFLKTSNRNNNEIGNLTQDINENIHFLHNKNENISNSPLKNKIVYENLKKIIHTQKTSPNNDTKLIIGRDFQPSSNYKSNNDILTNKQNLYSEHVSEFSDMRVREKSNDRTKEKENILFDNKKFDSFREIEYSKNLNKHEAFQNLLKKFNSIKDKLFRITNYSQQIELTSETIRDQISKNYSHLSEKISSNLNGLCDNIIGTSSKNNYYKRIIPNIVENSKKICLFDIKLQTFDIKEFEYLTIKLNVSINIDHDGSDLIFLSGGKVSNSMNFFKGEESFGDLSGQITALFLILRWSTKAIELNGQLLRKRAWHSSLFFNNKLYIIGGASSENLKLKECECYNIIQKQWELLPNLNYARCNPGLCIYNQEYLYVFNGWVSKNCFLDTIEFININHFSSNSWSTFKPEDPGLSWEGYSNCCATVTAENKILIFGGYKDEKLSSTFFFDPLKKTVFRGKDLVKASIFYNNALFFENKIYSVDNKNENRKIFGVHVYDISSNVWKYYQGPQ